MKDSLFIRGDKVPITKEEVRAVCLAKLDLYDAQTLLDVGAGSGSVGIEACIINCSLKVTGIEKNDAALSVVRQNIDKFGIKDYELIEDTAPISMDTLFDRVFIGGSGGNLEDIIKWSYEILIESGIAVGNFIVYENAIEAKRTMAECGYKNIELCQVMVNKSEKIGAYEYLKPMNPVFIIKGEK
jgi:cobalt-precorrin-6B (C15)-methyltransferase